MQSDLNADFPKLDIQILGVNEAGLDIGNAFITAGRNIPRLQDMDADTDGMSDMWTNWAVTYRDVVILDAQNIPVAVYNLTMYNLEFEQYYNDLRQVLVDAASVPEPGVCVLLILGTTGLLLRTKRRRRM